MNTARKWLHGDEAEVTLEAATTCTRCRGELAAGSVALRNPWGDTRHVECPARAPRPAMSCACRCHGWGFETACCPDCDETQRDCPHGNAPFLACLLCDVTKAKG